jgi:hypothetical protein
MIAELNRGTGGGSPMVGRDTTRAHIAGLLAERRIAAAVERRAGGYTLRSTRTGGPIARLRPTGRDGKVQVFWWNGERWGRSGPFGVPTMTLDRALDYVTSEPAFWIYT